MQKQSMFAFEFRTPTDIFVYYRQNICSLDLSKDKLYTWTGDSLRFSEICYWQNYQKMTLISFVDLWKKICFPKFEDCSPKIKSATVILSLIFSRAWQSYFLCHTHAFLKNCVFFIDEQMILVSFFYISTQNSVN